MDTETLGMSVRIGKKMRGSSKPRRGLGEHLDLEPPTPRNVRKINFCYLSYPVCFVMAALAHKY